MKKLFLKIKNWYTKLPDKKRHFELVSAILTIPMMLTVILVNLNNIKSQKNVATTSTNTTTPIQVVIDNPNSSTATASTITPTVTATKSATPSKSDCKKDIGPIEILSPQEGEVITTNNVCINISTDNNYCPVTWSYQLGSDSDWSDYNNNNICLYNLTPGKNQLNIKVKSTVVDKTITLQRNFIYQTASATPTTTATASATITP
jgi:hypothetical protein